jgi:hypothetical protein
LGDYILKSKIAFVIVLAALTSCTTSSPSEGAGKPAQNLPANYKAQIVERVHSTFNDPFSIKDAEISAPSTATVGFEKLPMVCFRLFAKSQYGAYMGQQTMHAVFKNGKMIPTGTLATGDCNGPWQPFPELNGKE